jgi:hypothetical protein
MEIYDAVAGEYAAVFDDIRLRRLRYPVWFAMRLPGSTL